MKNDEDLYIDSGFYDADMDGEYQKIAKRLLSVENHMSVWVAVAEK